MSDQVCLWKFFWDCNRMGSLEGLFLATQSEVDGIVGKEIYFGEVLGKHSKIHGTLESGDLTKLTDDPKDIEVIRRCLASVISGYNLTISGYSPLDYYDPRCEECGDELSDYDDLICEDCKLEQEEDEEEGE